MLKILPYDHADGSIRWDIRHVYSWGAETTIWSFPTKAEAEAELRNLVWWQNTYQESMA